MIGDFVMRFSTIFFTTLFIVFVAHGEYDIPGKDFVRGLCPSKKASPRAEESARCLKEIDRRVNEIEAIVNRLNGSEKALTQRLKEIRKSEIRATSRNAGGDPFGQKALLKQLKDLHAEQESAVASLERLKSERVRMKVRHDVLQVAAERKTIEVFLDDTTFRSEIKGPVDELADDMTQRAAVDGIDYEIF